MTARSSGSAGGGTSAAGGVPAGPVVCLCAGWDRPEALEAMKSLGLEVAATATRGDVGSGPLHMRRLVRSSGASSVIHFSLDSTSDLGPQIYTSALALVGRPCFRFDSATSTIESIGPVARIAEAVLLPVSVARSLLRAWRAGTKASGVPASAAALSPVEAGPGDTVMFVWPIRRERQVGGAITHAAGILRGFKDCGLKVALVARSTPPPQLDGLYDELELTDPVPAVDRCLPYTEMIAANRVMIDASLRLARRTPPTLVYQRHSAYAFAGSEIANVLGVPLVLEVNGPSMWTRFNWRDQAPGEGRFLELGRRLELRSVETALVPAAVSANAASGTLEECGADGSRMMVSPNAVDFEAIRRIADGIPQRSGSETVRLGWVGSFGPWHGASFLIEAMPGLPANVVAEMIGTGGEFDACRERVEELGLSERVSLPGALSHADAVARLASCDVLVSPHVAASETPFFGSPTKLFEFMAIGLPIVASDLEQIGEVLEDGRTAVLVRPGDVSDLIRGIESVIAMPDRGTGLGRAAMEEAREHHTWHRRAADMLSALAGRVPDDRWSRLT